MKNILKRFFNWVNETLKDLAELAEERAVVAVKGVAAVKMMVEDARISLVGALTAAGVDDRLIGKIHAVLAKAAHKLGVAHGFIKETESPLQALNLVIDHLRSINKSARRSWWIELAAETLGILMDGKVTFPELVGLTQMVFRKLFPGK
jgi:hypothetical protein